MRRAVLARLDRPSRTACWTWTGYRNPDGYGFVRPDGTRQSRPTPVHRFMYAVVHGPIPDNYDVHHTCGNRACANPTHLELQPAPVNRYWLTMRRWGNGVTG